MHKSLCPTIKKNRREICYRCRKIFSSQKHFLLHRISCKPLINKTHKNISEENKVLDSSSGKIEDAVNSREPYPTKIDNKEFYCTCGNVFRSYTQLSAHKAVCKPFLNKPLLKNKRRLGVLCSSCGSVSREDNIVLHKESCPTMNENHKKFHCKCGKEFDLQKHLSMHRVVCKHFESPQPNKCACGKVLASKSGYSRHIKTCSMATLQTIFTCKCGKVCLSAQGLTQHMKVCTQQNNSLSPNPLYSLNIEGTKKIYNRESDPSSCKTGSEKAVKKSNSKTGIESNVLDETKLESINQMEHKNIEVKRKCYKLKEKKVKVSEQISKNVQQENNAKVKLDIKHNSLLKDDLNVSSSTSDDSLEDYSSFEPPVFDPKLFETTDNLSKHDHQAKSNKRLKSEQPTSPAKKSPVSDTVKFTCKSPEFLSKSVNKTPELEGCSLTICCPWCQFQTELINTMRHHVVSAHSNSVRHAINVSGSD